MIKHIVMWRFKETAEKPKNMEKAKELLENLNGKIDGLLYLEVGIDIFEGNDQCDVFLYSEFEDRKSLDDYQIHPLHKAAADFIGRVRESRTAVDYEI